MCAWYVWGYIIRDLKLSTCVNASNASFSIDYSQDSGFGVFYSASGASYETGLGSREESRHTPWQV